MIPNQNQQNTSVAKSAFSFLAVLPIRSHSLFKSAIIEDGIELSFFGRSVLSFQAVFERENKRLNAEGEMLKAESTYG